MVILGDFNYSDINWKFRDSGSLGKDFLDLVNDCFLWQHIKQPTRGKNTLDLVLSSEENMIEEIEISCPISNSDHNTIFFQLICNNDDEESKVVNYSYDKSDYQSIRKGLQTIEWNSQFLGKSVEDMWSFWKNVMVKYRDAYVPKAKNYKRSYPKWMTGKIRRGIRKRNKAWQRYNASPQHQRLRKYQKLRNKVNKHIRTSKRAFEESLAEKIKYDPKAFYSYVRSKSKTKDRVGPLLDDRGHVTDDKKEMCSILNDYFSTVFTVEDLTNIDVIKNRGGLSIRNQSRTEGLFKCGYY